MQTWSIIYSSTVAAMVTVLVFFGIKSEIDFIRHKPKKPKREKPRKWALYTRKNDDAYLDRMDELAKIETEAKQISNKLDEIQ